MKWYEFDYNKPYHTMSMQERLRYEQYIDSVDSEDLDIDYLYFSGMEDKDWNLA